MKNNLCSLTWPIVISALDGAIVAEFRKFKYQTHKIQILKTLMLLPEKFEYQTQKSLIVLNMFHEYFQ